MKTYTNSPMSIAGAVQRSTSCTKQAYARPEHPAFKVLSATLTTTALVFYVLAAVAWTVLSFTLFLLPTILWRSIRRGQRTRKLRHAEMMSVLGR